MPSIVSKIICQDLIGYRLTEAVKAITRQLYISGGSTRIASLRTMRLNMPCIVIFTLNKPFSAAKRKRTIKEDLEETEIKAYEIILI
jgi:hypothetical protein